MTFELDDSGLREEFSHLRLPLALIDLDEMRILAITTSVLTPDGFLPARVVGRPVLDVIVAEERKGAELTLRALASGGVDFVRAHGHLVGEHEAELRTMWAAAIEVDGERIALVQLAAGEADRASPLEAYLGANSVELTIGTVDGNWEITKVSSGVERLLGVPAAEMIGTVLLGAVEEHQVNRVLRAVSATKGGLSVGLTVRIRGTEGWTDVQVVVGPLAGSAERFFILAPAHVSSDPRARSLEQHLRRIAAEVLASGVMEIASSAPAIAHLAERTDLTPRQWEILTRLLRGERVKMIARELFLSESTIRNHLSTIYARIGVHSQAELMALALGGGGFAG
jgi:DNA-binding CsgD family transcriptional regulator